MSNEEIRRAILEMDEREELAKDMLEQVREMQRWLSNPLKGNIHSYEVLTNRREELKSKYLDNFAKVYWQLFFMFYFIFIYLVTSRVEWSPGFACVCVCVHPCSPVPLRSPGSC